MKKYSFINDKISNFKLNLKRKHTYKNLIIKLICLLFSIFLLIYFKINNLSNYIFEKFDIKYLDKIESKLLKYNCSLMTRQHRLFLNGIVRKFRPKKILELGVNKGGSSIIILNALYNIKKSHLFSVDLYKRKNLGFCVYNFFPNLLTNWKLYTGNIAAKFIEDIGKNIDMAFLDTAHFEPGEILDFLMILPFLKKGALVGFHDIGHQINSAGWPNSRNEWAPYIIFNILKGKKYIPSGKNILTQDIGFIKLENNQNIYIHDYFRALGGQWQYFPKEEHIELLRKFINKYYDKACLVMFEEAIEFNRNFIKNNPKEGFNYSLAKKYRKK